MDKTFLKAAGVRALKTTCQTLASMLPVGFVIAPEMVQNADWSILYIVLAWLGTGLLSGVASFLTSIASGLPEVKQEAIIQEQDAIIKEQEKNEDEG